MSDTRTKSLRIRVSPQEDAELSRRARRRGFGSKSEFVRAAALGSAPTAGEVEMRTTEPSPGAEPSAEALRVRADEIMRRQGVPLIVARALAQRELGAPA